MNKEQIETVAQHAQALPFIQELGQIKARRELGRARELVILAWVARCRYSHVGSVMRLTGQREQAAVRTLRRMEQRGWLYSGRSGNEAIQRVYVITKQGQLKLQDDHGIHAPLIDVSKIPWAQLGHDALAQMVVASAIHSDPKIRFAYDKDLRGLGLEKIPDALLGRRAIEIQAARQSFDEVRLALGRLALLFGGQRPDGRPQIGAATVIVRWPPTADRYRDVLNGGSVVIRRKATGKDTNIKLDPEKFRIMPMTPEHSGEDCLAALLGVDGEFFRRALGPG